MPSKTTLSVSTLLATSGLMLAAFAGPANAQSDELVAAAKAEGMLTTIALPHDWCGWGETLKNFKD